MKYPERKKMKIPIGSFRPEDILNQRVTSYKEEIGSTILRPVPYFSIPTRLRNAWDVFTCRADALYWDYPLYEPDNLLLKNTVYVNESIILQAIPLNYREIKPLLVAKAIVKYLRKRN